MFVGREKELNQLNSLWNKKTSSFVVCRGRRRIGKSTLLEKFGHNAEQFLEFQGLAPEINEKGKRQQKNFMEQLSAQTEIPAFQPTGWKQLFEFLALAIRSEKKTVVLLDEISWMAAGENDFSAILKVAWDTTLKHKQHLILIVCGSVTSWIDEHILNNTGFMGRVSLEIMPEELTLPECNQFWRHRSCRVSVADRLKVLAVTGGVPRYLEEMNMKISAEDNIKQTCFTKEGFLFHEFDRIFNDIFGRRVRAYKQLVETLINGSMTLSEITNHGKIEKGGSVSRYLNDLVVSGFVSKDFTYSPTTGKPGKMVKYRLKDNYLRFYLKVIEPLKHQIEDGLYDDKPLELFLNWNSIIGLQFENLVLNNKKAILDKLNLGMASIQSCSPYWQKATKAYAGCQIDLLIQSKYALYPCEIKFQKNIDSSIISDMQKKIQAIKNCPTWLSIRPVLIYQGKVSKTLEQVDFFDATIEFSEFLS